MSLLTLQNFTLDSRNTTDEKSSLGQECGTNPINANLAEKDIPMMKSAPDGNGATNLTKMIYLRHGFANLQSQPVSLSNKADTDRPETTEPVCPTQCDHTG